MIDPARPTQAKKIADLPFYTEGPAIDSRGVLYLTTLGGGEVLQMDGEGRLRPWAHSPCPNGQIIVEHDEHLLCDVKLVALRRFDARGRLLGTVIEGRCDGVPFACPNDLIADAAGNLYFTDSVRHSGKLCFLGKDGRQRVLADGLDYPNGLVWVEAISCLFVAESYRNRILRIPLASAGQVSGPPSVFAELPQHLSGRPEDNLPDGLALDGQGRLWVAHYGMGAVQVLSPEGRLLATLDTGMPLTSNILFDRHGTAWITGGYGEPGPGGLVSIPGATSEKPA